MKIGIVGWGVEGQSLYKYFGPDHEYLIVNEEPRDDLPAVSPKLKIQYVERPRQPGITSNVEDLSYLEGLDSCDKIVYTPTSFRNLKRVFGDDKAFWGKTTTAMHLFFEAVKTKNIVGVTGTKGKGTTSTLIAKMLEASGKKVWLGGNIGLSVLDFVNQVQADDWVVLEMSNFQLYNFPYSPHIAVCLMLAPEHLDWHPNVEDYVQSKSNIFSHQTSDDIAIYLNDDVNSERIAGLSPGKKISYMGRDGAHIREDGLIVFGDSAEPIIPKSEVRLLGDHNLQNICAALTAFHEAGWNLEAAKQVATTFKGLEHRLELVREFKRVEYYDDSFGTSPETAIVAIRSFIQPLILILGGSDKGASYDELAKEVVKARVRKVIVIGLTAEKITEALEKAGVDHIDIITGPKTMPEVVAASQKSAEPGDVVLLSPACASFGLFKDYKDRGDQFKQAVANLR